MNRKKLISALEGASDVVSQKELDKVVTDSIDSRPLCIDRPGTRNLVIVIEELSELQKEISKFLRGKGDPFGLVEEIGDVYLALRYLEIICGIDTSDVNKSMNVKMSKVQNTVGTYE